MATINFQFIPADKKHCRNAKGWIVLGDHGTGNDGIPHLSAECVTSKEVEEYVDYLKKQLDGVLKKAKRKFKDSN